MTSASPVLLSVGLTLIDVLFECVEVEVCVSAGITASNSLGLGVGLGRLNF